MDKKNVVKHSLIQISCEPNLFGPIFRHYNFLEPKFSTQDFVQIQSRTYTCNSSLVLLSPTHFLGMGGGGEFGKGIKKKIIMKECLQII